MLLAWNRIGGTRGAPSGIGRGMASGYPRERGGFFRPLPPLLFEAWKGSLVQAVGWHPTRRAHSFHDLP